MWIDFDWGAWRRDAAGAYSVARGYGWALTFAITKTFDEMRAAWGQAGAFWFYGGCGATGVLFMALAVAETKGKTYEEIQSRFDGGRARTQRDAV